MSKRMGRGLAILVTAGVVVSMGVFGVKSREQNIMPPPQTTLRCA